MTKGRVVQIVAATSRYATADGITSSSSPEEVRRWYPDLQSFVRVGYHTEAEGGRDIIFWDDPNKGIAFEFWYGRTARRRYLEAIIIHEPGAQLLPEGRLESASEWQKLASYALEPPSSKSR